MADGRDAVLVGVRHADHIVAGLLIAVRGHGVSGGGQFLPVPVRLDLDGRASIAEVPDLLAGGRIERADLEGDLLARRDVARGGIVRMD